MNTLEYEFDFSDTCQICYGDGYTIWDKYNFKELQLIAEVRGEYLIATQPNHMWCRKCEGTGKKLDKLELEDDE